MTVFLVLGVLGLVLLALALLLGDLVGGALDALSGDVFSSAAIGGFVSAFGFGAALTDGLGAPLWLVLVAGAAVGLGFGFGWFAPWLTRQVTDNVAQTFQMLKSATGLDLQALVQRSATTMSEGLAGASSTNGDGGQGR